MEKQTALLLEFGESKQKLKQHIIRERNPLVTLYMKIKVFFILKS
ncbi:hypothetical protein QUF51_01270 [Bacillus pumilus]|nr:hypothetical protein [Bacillus pumilus]